MRLRTLLCSALALCCTPALWAAQQVWAPGVSAEGGWYDYNKQVKEGDYLGDTGLCWAYSASNVISWWQAQNADTLTASGVNVPQKEQILNTFIGVFKNVGCWPSAAYEWYIKGGEDCELNKHADWYKDYGVLDMKDTSEVTMQLGLTGFDIKDLAEGGILKDVFKDSTTIIFGALYKNDPFDLAEKIIQTIENGYALSLSVDINHSYTLWGVEYEETARGLMITKAWITDSDDVYNTGSGLLEKKIAYSEKEGSSGLYFDEHAGAVWENLAGIRTTATLIPEPGTATLTLMALAGLALRRRRS
jgi:hypothetical protein